MDHIVVHCECGETLRIKPKHGGRSGNCRNCKALIEIPSAELIEENLGRQVSVGDLSTIAGEAVEPTAQDPGLSEVEQPGDSVTGLWEPGQLVDSRYQVEKKLGQGGCGIVWKARHTEWNLDLAVKEFIDDEKLKPDKRERRRTNFVRESQAWVDDIGMHPHVVTAWYVRELQGTPYLFLEYCEGGDLGDWIDQGKTRDLKTALDIAIQLAWGLAHCHEKGIVHRDFKPQNVMMTTAGTAKITDFGMVKFAANESDEDDEPTGETAAGNIRQTLAGRGPLGTPPYMPPEQWGTAQIDHRADLYALGVTIYELLTGEYPIAMPSRRQFPAGGAGYRTWLDACREAHADDRPPALADTRDDVSAELDQVVQSCLAKRADDRLTDASTVVEVLRKIYEVTCGEPHGRPSPSEIQPLADGFNNQGVSLFDLGKEQAARQRFESATESDPQHPEANFNLGLIRWRKGELTDVELVAQLQGVCASHPDDWIDEYLLAQVHLERADHQSALELLESIEESAETNPEIASLLVDLRGGDLTEQCGKTLRIFESCRTELHSFVSVSGDGRFALAGSAEQTMVLWDVADGRCLRTIFVPGYKIRFSSVSISADGHHALAVFHSANDISIFGDKTMQMWDLVDGKCLWTFEGTPHITSVSFSADGRYVLTASTDKIVRLWDVADGTCLQTFEGHTEQVACISFSADGRYALSRSRDSTVRLWDIAEGKFVRTFEGHTYVFSAFAFSADGRYALSGSGNILETNSDNSVRLWDVTSGKCLRTFEGHTRMVKAVSFSADGRYALSRSSDSTVRLWDIAEGKCVRTFEGQSSNASISFFADGLYALSSEGGTLRLWQIGRPGDRKAAMRLTRVSDSQSLLQSQADMERHLRDARTAISDGEFGEAAYHLRHARSTGQNGRQPKLLKLWVDLYTRLPRTGFRGGWHQQSFEENRHSVESVSFSVDGRYALSGSEDKTVRLWDVTDGKCLQTMSGHTGNVSAVSLSADGCLALSGCEMELVGSSDYTMRLWDVTDGKCLRTFDGHTGSIHSVTFSADGRYALSCDDRMWLWDIATGKCLRTFDRQSGCIDSAAFSADGRYAISGSSDNTIRLWDVTSDKCLRTFEGHTETVTSVSLSADGRFALSGSWDNTLRLWDVARSSCLQVFKGHTGSVYSVSFSADGHYALSGSSDKTVRVWDAADGKCLRTFEGHSEMVTSVSLSEDGRYALSGSRDKTVRLWFLDWELDDRAPADWDNGALPYLQNFLTIHSQGTTRKPKITKESFQQLLHTLGCAGFGWLRPDGVHQKLFEMRDSWTGPPPLL